MNAVTNILRGTAIVCLMPTQTLTMQQLLGKNNVGPKSPFGFLRERREKNEKTNKQKLHLDTRAVSLLLPHCWEGPTVKNVAATGEITPRRPPSRLPDSPQQHDWVTAAA